MEKTRTRAVGVESGIVEESSIVSDALRMIWDKAMYVEKRQI
jgi:hypothetical protein